MNEKTLEQTAVEWLVEQLAPSVSLQQKYIDELLEQAKEMEKQQIIDAYGVKVKHSIEQGTTVYTKTFGEQYYNETFKSE
jgi:hypothetical protein